jgi:hypothetical protein
MALTTAELINAAVFSKERGLLVKSYLVVAYSFPSLHQLEEDGLDSDLYPD